MKVAGYFSLRKLNIVSLLIILILAASLANGADEIIGSWILKGPIYTYVFSFKSNGTVERTMNMETMTVWTGTGKYTIKGKNLSVKLDNTASNTVHTENYTVMELSTSTIKMRCAGTYFSDIKSRDITLEKEK